MTQTVERPKPQAIEPHGGTLVDLVAGPEERDEWSGRIAELPRHTLTQREQCDLEMLAVGGFSPLQGFMTELDYNRVVDDMRLADGTVWSLPITLSVDDAEAGSYRAGQDVALADLTGTVLGILHVEQKYRRDPRHEAHEVYRTEDENHPGVAMIYGQGTTLLGGPLTILALPQHDDFQQYRLTPAQTRQAFLDHGWRRIVAFQTRNPMHRAHEYLTKVALEICDGLMLHPLVGETKGDDVPAHIRMKCYEVMLRDYFPQQRVMLAALEASMRYAGPREAVYHALIRKNYGCTHFIVGRDHAGVGNYYGTYDAHYIFDQFEPNEIGITPLFFEHTFFCRKCDGMASFKTCAHAPEDRVILSGTKVRAMLTQGEIPPREFSRPEVAKVLIDGYAEEANRR